MVKRHVQSCKFCQEHNKQSVKYSKYNFAAEPAPMKFISMDLIGEFHPPSSKGNRYALTVICMFTGYTFCIPLPDKKAETVLKAYMNHVYCKHGGSLKILSDNGTEFKNKLMEEVSKELGVEYKVYSPPYRPQSNGRIESFHYFLKACIAKHITPQLEWDEAFAIYSSIKKLSYYLEDADIVLRSDHLPLKKFLHKNTLNTKVNNWAVEISPYRIHFKYIKGIKNTLADTMSRLIQIDPEAKLNPEPEGYEFGYHAFEDMEPIKSDIQEIKVTTEEEPIDLPQEEIKLPLSNEKLLALQAEDKFCSDISSKLQRGELQDKKPGISFI